MDPLYWIGAGLGVFLLGELMSHVFGKKQEQVKTMEQTAQTDVAAALQQAIDRLHQSVPARPAATVAAPTLVAPATPTSPAPTLEPPPVVASPASISPPPDVKVDKGNPLPVATTQAPPALPIGDQATREKVALAAAFGYGSPPYKALQAEFPNTAAVINQYRAGGPDTDPTFNASHASPRDYGYEWNHGVWVSPANPVGGNWNPTRQRFE